MATNSPTLAWTTIGFIVAIFISVILYFNLKPLNGVQGDNEKMASFIILIVTVISFAVSIGITEGIYINSNEISTGAKLAVGLVWSFSILALSIMNSVLRNFNITRDSRLYFFTSYLTLVLCVLIFEILYLNKMSELESAKVIDDSKTNTFLTAYGVIVVFIGIYSLL